MSTAADKKGGASAGDANGDAEGEDKNEKAGDLKAGEGKDNDSEQHGENRPYEPDPISTDVDYTAINNTIPTHPITTRLAVLEYRSPHPAHGNYWTSWIGREIGRALAFLSPIEDLDDEEECEALELVMKIHRYY